VHLGGELGDGEPVRRWGQRQGGAQRVMQAGSVQIDAANPGGTQLGSGGQLVEDVVAEEPVSTQSRAVANRSTMPASWVTIAGNFSIIRPQRNSAVLRAIAGRIGRW
jgi:hypothetical protein